MRPSDNGEITYGRGSKAGALILIALGILLLAAIPWMVVEFHNIRDAYKLEIKTAIVGLLAIGGGIYALQFARNARYVLDDRRVTAYDWRNREVGSIDLNEIASYETRSPDGIRHAPNLILTGANKKLEIAVGTKNRADLFQRIQSLRPEVHQAAALTAGDITNLPPVTEATLKFGRLRYIPMSSLLIAFGAFIVYISIEHAPQNMAWYGLAWLALPFLGLGIPALFIGIFERYILTPEGIRHIDWMGRTQEDIAWKDVVDFLYEWRESNRGGPPTYHYKIVARQAHLKLDSNISNWVMLRQMIVARLPKDAHVCLAPEEAFETS